MSDAGLPHEIFSLMPYRLPWLALLILSLIAVALLVAIIIYFRKRRPKHTILPASPRDLVRETRAKILRLKPPEHFPVGKVQQNYFFALGIAFRELIEYRFKVKAIGATLREIKPRLQVLPLSLPTIEIIVEFMARADQIKFADRPSDLEQARKDHKQVVIWTQKLTADPEDKT